MLKSAELGRALSKQDYDAALGDLRSSLLKVQAELEEAPFPVIILINGADGAGKGETLNTLSEWLDARFLHTEAFGAPSEAERARPEFWRYWMSLPRAGLRRDRLRPWRPLANIADKCMPVLRFAAAQERLKPCRTIGA